MNKISKDSKLMFYLYNSLIVSLIGTINLGICTAFFSLRQLSYVEISIIYTCLLLAGLLFEYPSGIFADIYGRKRIYAIGLLCISYQYLGYACFTEFFLLYTCAMVGGIGGALVSGSFQSWIMVEEKQTSTERLRKVFTILSAAGSIGSIVVGLVLALLNIKYTIIYYGMSFLMLIISIVTLFTFQDNYGDRTRITTYNKNIIEKLFYNKKYKKLILIYSLSIAYYSVFILFWQPRLLSIYNKTSIISGFYSFYLLGVFIVNIIVSKREYINKRNYLLICNFLMVFAIVLLSYDNAIVFLFGLLSFGIGFGALNPMFFSWISESIDSDNCASIISFISAVGTIISLFINILIGYVMDNFNIGIIPYIVICFGVICSLTLIKVK